MGRVMRMAILVAALGPSGCALMMPTPYQPYSTWNGGGFTETEVQPGLFLVRFIGNESTTPDRTADYALLRAADICLQRGKGFLRVGDLATQTVQSGYIPGTSTTTVVPSSDPNAPPIVSVDTMPPTLLYGPQSGLAVSCVESKQNGAWDASYLARAIRTKYSLS
jgi:hypothetical protein